MQNTTKFFFICTIGILCKLKKNINYTFLDIHKLIKSEQNGILNFTTVEKYNKTLISRTNDVNI